MTEQPGAVACSVCAAPRDAESPVQALMWVREDERGRVRWLCPRCARTHVRDIEAKLPSEYW
ncbi:hypothetical protein [Prauserella muralis]|uniref:hypothetical protein n=1 Tax=Prauserella muralis TaxID=588067 RepID=UPI000DD3A22C|nr:hypothetical protein [Prauserella muralis]TWE23733.1 hypothetical protein FHX69_5030 [Prauserella muralis]